MKVAGMQPYRKVLEQLRNRLRGDVNTMTDAALGTTSDEPNGHSSTTPTHPAAPVDGVSRLLGPDLNIRSRAVGRRHRWVLLVLHALEYVLWPLVRV